VRRHDEPALLRERRNERLPLVEAAAAMQEQDRTRGPMVGIDMVGIARARNLAGIEQVKFYIRDLQLGRLHVQPSRGGGP
jgi:hypothetical protein